MENEKQASLEKEVSRLISEEEIAQINSEAEEIIQKMEPASNEELNSIMDELSNLGSREQKKAGEALSNLRRPVKDLMKNHDNTEIPDSLLKLRSTVNELNPDFVKGQGIKGLFNKIFGGKSVDKYIAKYQSVETNIEHIVKGLLKGQDKLEEDNADLEIIKRDSQEKIYNLEKQVYLGNKLFKILEERKDNPEWSEKQNIISEAQEKVIVRTKNMSAMINVLHQSIAAVNVIKKNNEKLKESIRNSIDTTKNLAPVTAMIHMALGTQKKVITAVNQANQTIEDMLVANARSLKENTEETTKLLEKPSINLDKAKQAFNDIYSAIETQEASSRRIIENSLRYVEEMEELNSEIKQKLMDK